MEIFIPKHSKVGVWDTVSIDNKRSLLSEKITNDQILKQ